METPRLTSRFVRNRALFRLASLACIAALVLLVHAGAGYVLYADGNPGSWGSLTDATLTLVLAMVGSSTAMSAGTPLVVSLQLAAAVTLAAATATVVAWVRTARARRRMEEDRAAIERLERVHRQLRAGGWP